MHTTNGKGERKFVIPFNIVNCFASISRPNNISLIHTTTTNDKATLIANLKVKNSLIALPSFLLANMSLLNQNQTTKII